MTTTVTTTTDDQDRCTWRDVRAFSEATLPVDKDGTPDLCAIEELYYLCDTAYCCTNCDKEFTYWARVEEHFGEGAA